MCNLTLIHCRPCFRGGKQFTRLEDQTHCCSFNLASVESFIEHVFLSIDECPPDEESNWTSSAFVAGNLYADHLLPVFLPILQDLLLTLTKKLTAVSYLQLEQGWLLCLPFVVWAGFFTENSREAVKMQSEQTIIGVELMKMQSTIRRLNLSLSDQESCRAEEDSMTLSVTTDVPLSLPAISPACAGRARALPPPPESAASNLQLLALNTNEEITPGELEDFRLLREWRDSGPRYTRRHTKQKESETTEITYL